MDPRDAVLCGQCGRLLEEGTDVSAVDRRPCPSCGSQTRKFEVYLEESVVVEEGFRLKQKRPGQKRPVAEEIQRAETFRKTGARHRVERVIDRGDPNPDNWNYREKITDLATGEVVRQVDEHLKDHIGRGGAKPRTAGPP